MSIRALLGAAALVISAAAGSITTANADSAMEWPQFAQAPTHLGVAPAATPFTPENIDQLGVEWAGVFGSHASSESSAVIADGVAYIADFDGRISAFSMDGCGAALCDPLWFGQTDNDITGSPAVAGNLVLVPSADHRLYAFPTAGCATSPCKPAWTGKLGGAVVDSSVAVADGFAYVGGYDGRLYVFSVNGCGGAKICAAKWSARVGAPGSPVTSSPAVGGGFVFVGSNDGAMYVFPAAGCGRTTCSWLWRASLGGPAFGVSPTVSGGAVFIVGTMAKELLAFPTAGCGAQACKPLWRGDLGLFPSGSTTPAVANGVVYVASQGTPDLNYVGVVSAFPAVGCGASICQPLWTGVNFGSGFESSAAVAGDVVFVAKGPASGFPVDAGLFAYDARGCGEPVCLPLTFVSVGDEQFYLGSSVAISGDHVVFASEDNTDTNDKLYVFGLTGD